MKLKINSLLLIKDFLKEETDFKIFCYSTSIWIWVVSPNDPSLGESQSLKFYYITISKVSSGVIKMAVSPYNSAYFEYINLKDPDSIDKMVSIINRWSNECKQFNN